MNTQRARRELGISKAAARIRGAAVELFATKGFGATSTRDIAARLQLSPGAVYPHYKTKEALLYAISLEGHLDALTTVSNADDPAMRPVARLISTVSAHVQWHARNRELARVVQYELRSLSTAHFKEIASIRRKTSQIFADIIEKGCATGDFSPGDSTAAVLAITSLGVDVSRWFPARGFSHPDTLAARYADLCLRMVGADVTR